MNKGNLEFRYFEKGEYVITSAGIGIVSEDEGKIKTEDDFYCSEVLIKYRNSSGEMPNIEEPIKHDR